MNELDTANKAFEAAFNAWSSNPAVIAHNRKTGIVIYSVLAVILMVVLGVYWYNTKRPKY